MQIALLSDIHGNREAFEACLESAAIHGAERFVILGDIVGYGADPEWCARKAFEMAGNGAILVRGNHDQAVKVDNPRMTGLPRQSIEWTRPQLSAEMIDFVGTLPMTASEEDRLYVHTDISKPGDWNYVKNEDDARDHLMSCTQAVSFCGHIHRPAIYGLAVEGDLSHLTPGSMEPVALGTDRRWLCVMGAVGQPRDGNPKAAFGLYDTAARSIRYMRVDYDIARAVAKIRAAGLPERLVERLETGN